MLKLSATALLLSSFLHANDTKVSDFLKKSFGQNPNIVKLDVTIADKSKVDALKGWEAYIVKIDATIKAQNEEKNVSQKMIWFSNGDLITQDLVDMKTGTSLKESIVPTFKAEFYDKANLIYGSPDAKHKVAIFSDPLCPFCRSFVPKAIEDMKKDPKKFAIYYYHFPLASLHPAAVGLTKAAIAAELQGRKDVVLDLYKVQVDARESDIQKILDAFNKTLGTKITPADIANPEVLKHFNFGLNVADEMMVQGTPSVFFDGKADKSKTMYKKVQ
ncbi:MAG: DsbA family protein [Sulfurimonadaceae bacterium]|jgi:protein-disulfide isomerase